MMDNVDVFLDRMRNTYESLKLGSFERLPTWGDITDGRVRYEVEKISISPGNVFPRISTALAERMTSLCQALTASSETGKNFVVFYIYSPSNPSSIVEACTAFNQLFEDYKNALNDGKKPPNNELVLQLVPLNFVGASTSVVISSQADVTRLCLETYDRCTIFGGGSMPAPAIILEQVAPRVLDFKLSSTPSASLMHENSCIYVAYSGSIDGRWVSAAWTDYRGTQQMTASYCLGRKGRNLVMPFSEVATEIWKTTHDIISLCKVHWRVIITKTGGIMEHGEKDTWTSLAAAETKANISLVLTTVDTNPSLQLSPPAVKLSPALNIAFYSTPVSTPQPSILSPDQSGNPPTPSKDPGGGGGSTPGDPSSSADPATAEGLLTDITDQTWGCVVAHRPPAFSVSTSSNSEQFAPALQSGYLVKRGGTATEDPPVLMEVNLVHSDGNPRAHESLLRELLVHFRALGTLSRARGVTGGPDVRPWHIATAEKGVRALYLLM
jgi:mediator of RNA polymerase II transcription subunit 13